MYWRRRLPHWTPENSTIFVTWRLAGTRPAPAPAGPRWLIEPRIAAIFAEALLHGENVRRAYNIFAWVVMPNHVHVVMGSAHPTVRDHAVVENRNCKPGQQADWEDRNALLAERIL